MFKRFRVLIVGGGLSGLALANALINSMATAPLDVIVFERDTEQILTERGGYQIRLSSDGIRGLKECLDAETYAEIQARYGTGSAEAPTLVDPTTTNPLIRLADVKLYAKCKAISRRTLRAYLLRNVVARNAIRFAHRVVGFDVVYVDEGERVKVFFEDGSHELGDVIISADGSQSIISEQVGLSNRTHAHGGFHLTSRGPIDEFVISRLPKALQEDGAIAFFGSGSFGFISIYRTEDLADVATVADGPHFQDPHLYWAVSFPGHIPPNFSTSIALDLKIAQKTYAQELMRSKGFHPSMIDILDVGDVETVRLTTEMLTSTRPPHNWRTLAGTRIGKNGGHRRVFIIGDSMHPMTRVSRLFCALFMQLTDSEASRGMGANQALCDATELFPHLVALARSNSHASPEEIIELVEKTNATFEAEMLPRAFGWVITSNRSAELDITTWEGKVMLYVLWVVMSLAGYLVGVLETAGMRQPDEPHF